MRIAAVADAMTTPPRDLTERSLRFSRELLRFIEGEQSRRAFPPRLLDQLMRAGTSIGAQNAEADSAISRKHLLALRARALQEATETQYWLKVLAATEPSDSADAIRKLTAQASELVAILTVCVKRLRGQ